jgi:hypothetical protein
MTKRVLAALVLLLVAGPGCGNKPKLVSVTGKVMHNGKPLTAGSIIFHPDAGNSYQKDRPSSLLQEDGSFTMKTFPFGNGVPLGTYKVTLAPEVANRIHRPAYAQAEKTPWSVTVPDGGLSDQVFEVK